MLRRALFSHDHNGNPQKYDVKIKGITCSELGICPRRIDNPYPKYWRGKLQYISAEATEMQRRVCSLKVPCTSQVQQTIWKIKEHAPGINSYSELKDHPWVIATFTVLARTSIERFLM